MLKGENKEEICDEGLKGGNIHRYTIILSWQNTDYMRPPHSGHRDKNWGLIDYTVTQTGEKKLMA